MMLYTRNAKFIFRITLIHLFAISAVFAADPAPPAAPLWGFETPKLPTPPNSSGTKWHPGHYMLVYRNSSQSSFDIIFNEPNFKGVQKRYWWGNLEKAKGVYDFSEIESDLAYLQSRGKRLIIQIVDRAFADGVKKDAVPAYLLSNPTYGGGVYPTKNGWIARIWDPVVMDREIALMQALGKRFDSEPYVEMVALAESATGIPGYNYPAEYTRRKHATQLKRALAAMRKAFPTTVVVQYVNSLVGEVEGLIENARQVGGGVGGPDIIPKNPIKADGILTGSPGYQGKLPMGYAVQAPALCGKEGCNTPEELYQYGVNTLKLNYIFWLKFGTGKGQQYSFKYGMIPTVNSHDGYINTACPESIAPCNRN